MCTRNQEKGAMIPQETDPDLPMKVKEFPAEVCVTLACCRVGATECGSVCMDLLKEVAIIFITSIIVWSQGKEQGGNTALPINSKLDKRFTEHGPAH